MSHGAGIAILVCAGTLGVLNYLVCKKRPDVTIYVTTFFIALGALSLANQLLSGSLWYSMLTGLVGMKAAMIVWIIDCQTLPQFGYFCTSLVMGALLGLPGLAVFAIQRRRRANDLQ